MEVSRLTIHNTTELYGDLIITKNNTLFVTTLQAGAQNPTLERYTIVGGTILDNETWPLAFNTPQLVASEDETFIYLRGSTGIYTLSTSDSSLNLTFGNSLQCYLL